MKLTDDWSTPSLSILRRRLPPLARASRGKPNAVTPPCVITSARSHVALLVERDVNGSSPCRGVSRVEDVRANGCGITTVLGGDFQQILPDVHHGSRADIVFASLLRSPLWNGIEILRLTRNMHLANDPDAQAFSSWLLDVGHGRGLREDESISLPQEMISPNINTFVEATYPGIGSSPPPPPEYFLDRVILAPRNNNVDTLNDRLLDMMSGEEQLFFSADTVAQEAGADDETSDVNSSGSICWTCRNQSSGPGLLPWTTICGTLPSNIQSKRQNPPTRRPGRFADNQCRLPWSPDC